MTQTIAIAGGGLGGVLAAILLQRAGHAVTVYEQAPQLARIGAGINLGANVMHIMRHIGLEQRMNGIGMVPQTGASARMGHGPGPVPPPVRAMGGTLRRPQPDHAPWRPARRPGLRPGARHAAIRQAPGGPGAAGERTRLDFADRTSVTADVVIGADGVNSRVREILLDPEPPTYSGTVAYRAIFPTDLLRGELPEFDSTKWWSDERLPSQEDRHFIVYYLTANRDEIYFVTGSPAAGWDGNTASIPADMEEILACYEGFHPEGDPDHPGLPRRQQMAAAGAPPPPRLERGQHRPARRFLPPDEAPYGSGRRDGVRGRRHPGAQHRRLPGRRAGRLRPVRGQPDRPHLARAGRKP